MNEYRIEEWCGSYYAYNDQGELIAQVYRPNAQEEEVWLQQQGYVRLPIEGNWWILNEDDTDLFPTVFLLACCLMYFGVGFFFGYVV